VENRPFVFSKILGPIFIFNIFFLGRFGRYPELSDHLDSRRSGARPARLLWRLDLPATGPWQTRNHVLILTSINHFVKQRLGPGSYGAGAHRDLPKEKRHSPFDFAHGSTLLIPRLPLGILSRVEWAVRERKSKEAGSNPTLCPYESLLPQAGRNEATTRLDESSISGLLLLSTYNLNCKHSFGKLAQLYTGQEGMSPCSLGAIRGQSLPLWL
jgi:hypothetical protein